MAPPHSDRFGYQNAYNSKILTPLSEGLDQFSETVRIQWNRSGQDAMDNSGRKLIFKFALFSKNFC